MEELLHNLNSFRGNYKAELLKETLKYGSTGINLLIETLNDPELIVRVQAYQLLQSIDSDKTRNAIDMGILLNAGDNIYCVYESVLQYNDNWWYIIDSFYDILFYYDWESTSFISFHIHEKSAEIAASNFHKQEVSIEHRICPFEINDVGTSNDCFRKDFNYIFEWCKTHNIPVKLLDENIRKCDPQKYYQLALSLENCIETDLIANKQYELLAQLWLNAVGKFAFVQPMVVQETTYMKL